MDYGETMERIARVIEAAGVAVIVVGAAIAVALFLWQMRRGGPVDAAYERLRRGLGRALLLGLEFLVAGDIIDTVSVEPTFRSLGVLAILVAIRTFLSTELELEIDGRWPWQRHEKAAVTAGGAAGRTASPVDGAREAMVERR